jgi:anti-sigma factor RsiW
MQWYVVRTKSHGIVYLPLYLSGVPEFLTIVQQRTGIAPAMRYNLPAHSAPIAEAWLEHGDAPVAAAAIESHVRAMLTGHRIASPNPHTVGSWFAGRVEVLPPVADLSADGFPLLGARVDYIAARAAAVLIYGHGPHVIEVYAWRQPDLRSGGEVRSSEYSVIWWSAGEAAYAAVSDSGLDDLRRLAGRFKAAHRANAELAAAPLALGDDGDTIAAAAPLTLGDARETVDVRLRPRPRA